MGRLGRFSSRRRKCVNKDAAANIEAEGENQEAERCKDGSPSAYLNLDQDAEAKEVAPEVCETISEPSRRGKRGPNKMPKSRTLINELDELGEPVDPVGVMGPYKSTCGVMVKDNIPIKYRVWSAKDKIWAVPESLKDICWDKLKEKYIFPEGSEEVAKKRALFIMSNSFGGWKGDLFRGHVQKGTQPDWKYFPNQQQYWDEFVSFKLSKPQQALSEKNKVDSSQDDNPHRTGRGYLRKIPEWEQQQEQLIQSGVTLQMGGILAL